MKPDLNSFSIPPQRWFAFSEAVWQLSCIGFIAYSITPHPGPLPSKGEGVVSAPFHFITESWSRPDERDLCFALTCS
jgi:hypothetical protein